MRLLRLFLTATFSLLLFEGCATLDSIGAMTAFETDPLLPKIKNVKALPSIGSVGFEWKSIKDSAVKGINIYRGFPGANRADLKLIGSTSRYATHFVDITAKPDREYLYTFTTTALGRESLPGKVIRIKTPHRYNRPSFAKVFVVGVDSAKVLWSPHSNPAIVKYLIQRRRDGGDWLYLAEVRGRLGAEYVDNGVRRGHSYTYRVFGVDCHNIASYPKEAGVLNP